MNRLIFIIILIVLGSVTSYGQDQHFSHFIDVPAKVNPALIATTDNFNINVLNRNQWKSIVDPFVTYNINASYPLLNRKNVRWGAAGFSFLNNVSGENGLLVINNISGIFSYNLRINTRNNLSIGIQPTYISKRIDINKLTSGSQWINNTFNSGAPLNETFLNSNINYLEVSSGILWYNFEKDGNLNYYSGISFANLNRPTEAFLTGAEKLPIRFSYVGGFKLLESEKVRIEPQGLVMWQARSHNVIVGSKLNYKFNPYSPSSVLKESQIGIGLFYRVGDAVVLSTEIVKSRFRISFMHDFKFFSSTQNASTTGANEVLLAYRIPVEKKKKTYYTQKKSRTKSIKPNIPQENIKEKIMGHTIVCLTVLNDSTKEKPHIKIDRESLSKLSLFEIDSSYTIDSSLIFKLPSFSKLELELYNTGYFDQKVILNTKNEDTIRLSVFMNEIQIGNEVILENILFENKSAQLDTSSYKILQKWVAFLKNNPTLIIEIGGHSDEVGSNSFNDQLSLQRAESIKTYFINNSIPSDRLQVKGYGETEPLSTEKSESAKALNRRVEIKILYK